MRSYAALVRTLGKSSAFAWVASRLLPPIDLRFRGRRRSLTSLGSGFPLCYLTTRGRRSGRERTVPLLYVPGDDGALVVIASNWGRARPPAWSLNLAAAGAGIVTIAGQAQSVCARPATAAEAERYWARAVELWPAYESYRRRAGRDVPLFVLHPIDSTPSGRSDS